jgi:hypothetical protein
MASDVLHLVACVSVVVASWLVILRLSYDAVRFAWSKSMELLKWGFWLLVVVGLAHLAQKQNLVETALVLLHSHRELLESYGIPLHQIVPASPPPPSTTAFDWMPWPLRW